MTTKTSLDYTLILTTDLKILQITCDGHYWPKQHAKFIICLDQQYCMTMRRSVLVLVVVVIVVVSVLSVVIVVVFEMLIDMRRLWKYGSRCWLQFVKV